MDLSPASSCDSWQGQGTSRRLAPLPSQGSVRRAASVMRAARRERGARLNLRGVAGVPGSKLALGDFSHI